MRPLILHHHVFKNAGTSVDVALQRAFGPRWQSVEGEGRELVGDDLAALLAIRPDLVAVSSHTFRPPFEAGPGVRLLPIVFLRHPLDRVRSAYAFERHQVADTSGARLAKQTDFAGYVRARLGQPEDPAIRDFQSFKLIVHRPGRPRSQAEELSAALDALASLPFVGLVETYDASLQVFARLISREFGPVSLPAVQANVTREPLPLAARVARAEAELGPELTARFWEANRNDRHLFELVRWMHGHMLETAAVRPPGEPDPVAAVL
jgi:hypothetical protein